MTNKLTPHQRGVCGSCSHSMVNKAWYGTQGRCGAYVFPNTDARPQLCPCKCKVKA